MVYFLCLSYYYFLHENQIFWTFVRVSLKKKEVPENKWKIDYFYSYRGYVGFKGKRKASEWILYLFSMWLNTKHETPTIQLSSRNRRGFFAALDDFIFKGAQMHPFL